MCSIHDTKKDEILEENKTIEVTRSININELAPEVFQFILEKYIQENNWRKAVTLRRVCKKWRSNIDSYLSTKQMICYKGHKIKGQPPSEINFNKFRAMLRFYPNLRHIYVNDFTINSQIIKIMQHNCPKIDRLSLSGCRYLTIDLINLMISLFPHMKFIDVSYCDLDENLFSFLCIGFKNLKIISAINPGQKVTGQCLCNLSKEIVCIIIGLAHLNDPNPALLSLVSANYKKFSHFGLIVRSFQKTNWNIITDNMQNLKSLKITFGSYGYGKINNFGKLTELEILVIAEDSRDSFQSVLNDEFILNIIKGCRKLKSIAIAGTKKETCRFTHLSISQFPIYCPYLQEIRFLNSHNVLDETLFELSNLRCISVLHLSSMIRVSNQGVISFLKKSKNTIKNFSASDCPEITEEIIDSFIEVAKLRPLEIIKLELGGITSTRFNKNYPCNLKVNINKMSSPYSTKKDFMNKYK